MRLFFILTTFLWVASFVSCTSESEKILNEKLAKDQFDFSKCKGYFDGIKWELKDGIQYGTITFKDRQSVKFWFLSHHISGDDGGTVYEFPDSTKHFYGGLHCCEVQFDSIFNNFKDFQSYIDKYEGVRP